MGGLAALSRHHVEISPAKPRARLLSERSAHTRRYIDLRIKDAPLPLVQG